MLVHRSFVAGITVGQHSEGVSRFLDYVVDVLLAQPGTALSLAQCRLCRGPFGLGLRDPPGDECRVGVIREGFQRGAVPAELAVALGDLLPGFVGGDVVAAVLRCVQLFDEPRQVAGPELPQQPARPGTMVSSRR